MATTAPTTLTLTHSGSSQVATLRRVAAIITRVLRMDPGAMVRLVHITPATTDDPDASVASVASVASGNSDSTDLLISTPLGCVVAQRITATVSEDGAVVSAERLLGLLSTTAEALHREHQDGNQSGPAETKNGGEATGIQCDLGGRLDMLWTGTAPPASGWTVVDTIPGVEVRDLFDQLQVEAETHSGPAGLPPSLLDQPLLRLTSRTQTGIIEVPGSVVAALGALGLVAEPREELRDHDRIRVSVTGSWIRIDALFGTVYLPRPGGLARIPSPR